MPATRRGVLSALVLLGLWGCGSSDEPEPGYSPGSIEGPWSMTAIGGVELPGIVPETEIVLFDGAATFLSAGTFTITYHGALYGNNIVLEAKGTWVADGGTFRLFGQSTLNGEPFDSYLMTAGVTNRVLTLYSSPTETWDRP